MSNWGSDRGMRTRCHGSGCYSRDDWCGKDVAAQIAGHRVVRQPMLSAIAAEGFFRSEADVALLVESRAVAQVCLRVRGATAQCVVVREVSSVEAKLLRSNR